MSSHFNKMFYGLICCVLAGCGSDLPQTIKVTGKVTFDGGPPPGSGVVNFLPIESAAGFPLRPGNGDFGNDGSYSAYTFEPNDGLMPGKYKVYLECWETPPNMEGKPVKSHLPKKYQGAETSGFTLDIEPKSGAQTFDLNVVTK